MWTGSSENRNLGKLQDQTHLVDKGVKYLILNINVINVLSWIKYWLMWFENFLVFILFKKKKKRPNISGIRVVVNIALVIITDFFQKHF